jgi:probable F420-dependent oxidoreductase
VFYFGVLIDTQLAAPLGSAADEAARLRDAGFDGVFTFEGPNDVFFPLVEAARAGVDIYTNVAIAFPRSPLHLAHQAWDLQRLSKGRFALGLGTQVRRHIEQRYSAEWTKPVARMRELVEAIKAIFAAWQDGEPLGFEGEFFHHTYLPPLFRPAALSSPPPPIWVGAVGPRLTRTVAEVADGLLVHPFHSERFLEEHTLPIVDAGLHAAGRPRGAFSVIADVIVCAGRDDAELAAADAGSRGLLAFYGSTPAYAPVLDLHGWTSLQPTLQRLVREGRWAEMSALIDDEMLATLTVRGSPAEVAAELIRRYEHSVERVGFYLPYAHDETLTTEIIDQLKAS